MNDPAAIEQPIDTQMDLDADAPALEKVDGRTREGRAARAGQEGLGVQSSAAPQRAATRRGPRQTASREPSRDPARGDAVVLSRNGEVLSRKRHAGVDPFEIPAEIVPEGWTYQWNVVSVIGNADICMDQGMGMFENGWRPVPAGRHPGRFVPHGTKGEIVRGGQRLEERPLSLTQDARHEEVLTAKRLISDRNDSLKLSGVNRSLPDGFDPLRGDQRRFLKTGGDNVRMSIDRGLDIAAPQHTLAEPGE